MKLILTSFAKSCRKVLPNEGIGKIFDRYVESMQGVLEAYRVGRTAFYRICKEDGLYLTPKKRRYITTDSNHRYHKYPNQIKDLAIVRPEQVWASDITYINTAEGPAYLFLITDHYSKRIVGWQLGRNMTTAIGIEALEMAIKERAYPDRPLIHHSDRGSQYCSDDYIRMLTENKIGISMTENGDPYENAIAERINGTIKNEFGISHLQTTFKETKARITEAVNLYNDYRRHHSNGGLTPNQMHSQQEKPVKRYGKGKSTNLATSPKEETGSAEEQPVSSMVSDKDA